MEEYRQYQKEILQANSVESADAVKIEQPSEEKSSSTETDMSEEKKSPETSIDLEAFAKEAAEKLQLLSMQCNKPSRRQLKRKH